MKLCNFCMQKKFPFLGFLFCFVESRVCFLIYFFESLFLYFYSYGFGIVDEDKADCAQYSEFVEWISNCDIESDRRNGDKRKEWMVSQFFGKILYEIWCRFRFADCLAEYLLKEKDLFIDGLSDWIDDILDAEFDLVLEVIAKDCKVPKANNSI